MPTIVWIVLILCPILSTALAIFYQYATMKVAHLKTSRLLLFLSGVFGFLAGLLVNAFILGVFDEVLGLTGHVF
jgi:hypothetical protein